MSLTTEQLYALYSVARMHDNSIKAFLRTYQSIDKHNRSQPPRVEPCAGTQHESQHEPQQGPQNQSAMGDPESQEASSASDSCEDECSDSSFVQSSVEAPSELDAEHASGGASQVRARDEVDLVSDRGEQLRDRSDHSSSQSARYSPGVPLAHERDNCSSHDSAASSPRN
jgi:hypothetical protein